MNDNTRKLLMNKVDVHYLEQEQDTLKKDNLKKITLENSSSFSIKSYKNVKGTSSFLGAKKQLYYANYSPEHIRKKMTVNRSYDYST